MTVASLWKALDQAGCGQAVGEEDMIDPHRKTARVNPWTYNEGQRRHQQLEDRPSLAVDLSIWICESLTSTAMNDHNENPTLQLVYARTMKLLNMGIKLVYVIEGKRRIRCSPGEKQDKFRRRRSGTSFWKACKQCEEMLTMLGVPVVRAKAEGEALCALLNQQGIVDGVISNDGDCLLFGAKVVYTKFSIENLDKGCVMRYDSSRLSAIADASSNAADDREETNRNNNDDNDNNNNNDNIGSENLVVLSREDLIAFALLTGSDLAGDGIAKVGHKKAVRFIKKCREDYPLTPQTAAMEELRSWARTAGAIDVNDSANTGNGNNIHESEEVDAIELDDGANKAIKKTKQTCCSRCNHAGSKRSHEKHGCEICGTEPGEPCYKLSSDDKFRKSLRQKALAMTDPKFDPTLVVDSYMRPNDNQLPATLLLAGMSSSKTLRMGYPKMTALVSWPVVVKGHCLRASQDYLKQSVARLLARKELFQSKNDDNADTTDPDTNIAKQQSRPSLPRERPVPKEIVRKLVQNRVDCYEVRWTINATITDKDGEGMDGYEFSTIELQDMVERLYPKLVEAFRTAPKEFKKQGESEMQKRREFLETLFQTAPQEETDKLLARKRQGKDERNIYLPLPPKDDEAIKEAKQKHKRNGKTGGGDDVEQLLRFAKPPVKSKKSDTVEDFDFSSIESGSLSQEVQKEEDEEALNRPLIPLRELDPSQIAESEPRNNCSAKKFLNSRDPVKGLKELLLRPRDEPESVAAAQDKKKVHGKKKKKRKKKRSRQVTSGFPERQPAKQCVPCGSLPVPDMIGTKQGNFHRPIDHFDDMSSVTNGVHLVPPKHPKELVYTEIYPKEQQEKENRCRLPYHEREIDRVEFPRRTNRHSSERDQATAAFRPNCFEAQKHGVSPAYKRNRLNPDLSMRRQHQGGLFGKDGSVPYIVPDRYENIDDTLDDRFDTLQRIEIGVGAEPPLRTFRRVSTRYNDTDNEGGFQSDLEVHEECEGALGQGSSKAIRGKQQRRRKCDTDETKDFFIDVNGDCWQRVNSKEKPSQNEKFDTYVHRDGEQRDQSSYGQLNTTDDLLGTYDKQLSPNNHDYVLERHRMTRGQWKRSSRLEDLFHDVPYGEMIDGRRELAEDYSDEDHHTTSPREKISTRIDNRRQQSPLLEDYDIMSIKFGDMSMDDNHYHNTAAPESPEEYLLKDRRGVYRRSPGIGRPRRRHSCRRRTQDQDSCVDEIHPARLEHKSIWNQGNDKEGRQLDSLLEESYGRDFQDLASHGKESRRLETHPSQHLPRGKFLKATSKPIYRQRLQDEQNCADEFQMNSPVFSLHAGDEESPVRENPSTSPDQVYCSRAQNSDYQKELTSPEHFSHEQLEGSTPLRRINNMLRRQRIQESSADFRSGYNASRKADHLEPSRKRISRRGIIANEQREDSRRQVRNCFEDHPFDTSLDNCDDGEYERLDRDPCTFTDSDCDFVSEDERSLTEHLSRRKKLQRQPGRRNLFYSGRNDEHTEGLCRDDGEDCITGKSSILMRDSDEIDW